MMDEKDETANYHIYVFDLDSLMQPEEDGIEVAATMKSLVLSMHQIVLGNRETTPEDIHYYFIRHVADLLQLARMAATITKLQMIIEILQRAKNALEQEEDAEQSLRDAWQQMRSVLSQEEIEKVSARQIELRRSGIDPILVSGPDVWEQANHILQEWSTPEHEDARVEYVVGYLDGHVDGRWLNLPLFYTMDNGERWRIGPELDLGNLIIAALETSIDLCSQQHASFEAARYDALAYLKNYKIGGNAGVEAVTTAILKLQKEHWSPGITYRHALHTEHNRREGVLTQRMGGTLPLHATYTPSDEVAWEYRLYLAGIYDLQVVKRLTNGQEVAIQGAVQDASRQQTYLDFSVLPGDEDPAILQDGETVQMMVRQAEAVIASVVFHREEDDSLTVETARCDVTYLP